MPELRINHRIRIKSVRLIDEIGTQVGIVPTDEARKMATEKGLDLVEISPKAAPPVCKIMNYGKFKYSQRKKDRQAKRKHHVVHMKELRISPKTGEHDLMVKIKHARQFIERGDKVLVTLFFRGRQITHKDLGLKLMARFAKELEDLAKIESPVKSEGRRLNMTLTHK
ncbi:MAG: translation initiation factor IF-3 [Planctomycetes bacterium]|nr:translation initiation factor IF-3 [Planctomycetota bacterium]MCK5578295.1 translation initiation factor IF-3 [Planctomycetota bacterium]